MLNHASDRANADRQKVEYGYRMEYDDFADKYWPLVGERVYETDH